MTAAERRGVDSYGVFLIVACVALAGLVVALTIQNRSLKEQLAHGGGPPPPQFESGDSVAPFTVVSDSGESKTIAFGEGETKTVLLVFSSTCPACKDTVPIWRDLMAAPPPSGVRVVGVQTDRLDKNPAAPAELAASFPFPVFGYKRAAGDPLAKVPFIPAAIVIDAKGVVVNAWFGVPGVDAIAGLKSELGG